MKIAILHDWLATYAGAERVLEQFITMFPDADVYSLVDFIPENHRKFLQGKKVRTSFIQKLPFASTKFRNYLPLFYSAVRAWDLSQYDLILSSSHCMVKNVRTRPGQLHLCYCHSPVRYAWDMQDEYLDQTGLNSGLKGLLIRTVMAYVRKMDLQATSGVTQFIANSSFIGERIKACYGRDSVVVNPPVMTDEFTFEPKKQDYYVTASRMVPYKHMYLIAEAFAQMPDKNLVIIGDGPEMPKVQAAAEGHPNINVMGYQKFAVLKQHMQQAKAFVFAAKEDFGITPVEAMACGTPVIAFGEGGILDSVIPAGKTSPTGILYPEQTPQSLIKAVKSFEKPGTHLTAENCRKRAENFSPEHFRERMLAVINQHLHKAPVKKPRKAA